MLGTTILGRAAHLLHTSRCVTKAHCLRSLPQCCLPRGYQLLWRTAAWRAYLRLQGEFGLVSRSRTLASCRSVTLPRTITGSQHRIQQASPVVRTGVRFKIPKRSASAWRQQKKCEALQAEVRILQSKIREMAAQASGPFDGVLRGVSESRPDRSVAKAAAPRAGRALAQQPKSSVGTEVVDSASALSSAAGGGQPNPLVDSVGACTHPPVQAAVRPSSQQNDGRIGHPQNQASSALDPKTVDSSLQTDPTTCANPAEVVNWLKNALVESQVAILYELDRGHVVPLTAFDGDPQLLVQDFESFLAEVLGVQFPDKRDFRKALRDRYDAGLDLGFQPPAGSQLAEEMPPCDPLQLQHFADVQRALGRSSGDAQKSAFGLTPALGGNPMPSSRARASVMVDVTSSTRGARRLRSVRRDRLHDTTAPELHRRKTDGLVLRGPFFRPSLEGSAIDRDGANESASSDSEQLESQPALLQRRSRELAGAVEVKQAPRFTREPARVAGQSADPHAEINVGERSSQLVPESSLRAEPGAMSQAVATGFAAATKPGLLEEPVAVTGTTAVGHPQTKVAATSEAKGPSLPKAGVVTVALDTEGGSKTDSSLRQAQLQPPANVEQTPKVSGTGAFLDAMNALPAPSERSAAVRSVQKPRPGSGRDSVLVQEWTAKVVQPPGSGKAGPRRRTVRGPEMEVVRDMELRGSVLLHSIPREEPHLSPERAEYREAAVRRLVNALDTASSRSRVHSSLLQGDSGLIRSPDPRAGFLSALRVLADESPGRQLKSEAPAQVAGLEKVAGSVKVGPLVLGSGWSQTKSSAQVTVHPSVSRPRVPDLPVQRLPVSTVRNLPGSLGWSYNQPASKWTDGAADEPFVARLVGTPGRRRRR
mmetsp:Transcript_108835/g.249715  ORF Transcript_108835/g.249715 Transcript_108835/m.249715 type:complete len:878 (-) Transcript_108835:303-2936(-)